jgi:hypothetical protein
MHVFICIYVCMYMYLFVYIFSVQVGKMIYVALVHIYYNY